MVFLARTPQNVVSFIWPVKTCKMMHQICYGFYSSIKKWLKLCQKNWFFSSFWKFFLCMLYYTLWVMSQYFSNWKILLRYSSVVGFISTGHVVEKFKVFLLIQYPWDGPFLGFLGLYSLNYCSICLKWSVVVPNQTNTVFQKSFKILNFGSNGMHPKFTVLVHFGAQFTARKPKILLKTRISAKTTYRPISLGISNNISLRSEKNHYPCKIKQKKFSFSFFLGGSEGRGQIGSKFPPGPISKGNHKFSLSL